MTYHGNPYDYPIEKLTNAVTYLAVSEKPLRAVLQDIRQTVPLLGMGIPPVIEGLSEDSLKKFYALRDSLDLRRPLPEDVHDIATSMCKLAFQLCEERGRAGIP